VLVSLQELLFLPEYLSLSLLDFDYSATISTATAMPSGAPYFVTTFNFDYSATISAGTAIPSGAP